jgi:uncharacterized protein (DUF2236 family)
MSDSEVPQEVREILVGFGLLGAGANIVMQLARLPVGHGVVESRVHSGRGDLHPLKRFRTTTAYLAVALLGTDDERRAYRSEVNRSHREVHSRLGDPVEYDAFDPELQLWVAACLYKGSEDIYRLMHSDPDPEALDRLYAYSSRLGTTLQVRADMWPADRAAFAAYWNEQAARIEIDELTREYLLGIAEQRFVFAPLGRWGAPGARLVAPAARFFTTGFLPDEFRAELGLDWSARRQRLFERSTRMLAAVNVRLPEILRAAPYNLVLWDTRRRIAAGRPVV